MRAKARKNKRRLKPKLQMCSVDFSLRLFWQPSACRLWPQKDYNLFVSGIEFML